MAFRPSIGSDAGEREEEVPFAIVSGENHIVSRSTRALRGKRKRTKRSATLRLCMPTGYLIPSEMHIASYICDPVAKHEWMGGSSGGSRQASLSRSVDAHIWPHPLQPSSFLVLPPSILLSHPHSYPKLNLSLTLADMRMP